MTARRLYLFGFLLSAAAMAFAYYLEYLEGLTPCALCIFQRVAMVAAGLFFLAGAVHDSPGLLANGIYAGGAGLASAVGAGLAGRHVWLQSLPPGEALACGPSLDYMLDVFPLAEVVAKVLRGDGDCAEIDWSFLGLSIPAWTLAIFTLLALLALGCWLTARWSPLSRPEADR